jgi:hypothetical protein
MHAQWVLAGEEGTLLPTPAHSQQAVEQPVMGCSDFGQESNEVREREREIESKCHRVSTMLFCCRIRVVLTQPVQEWWDVCVVATRPVALQVSTAQCMLHMAQCWCVSVKTGLRAGHIAKACARSLLPNQGFAEHD